MAKNLMPRIAEMLGVEIGERFKERKKDSEIYYFTDAAFLKQVNDAESEDFVSDLEEEDLLVLYYLLSGKETVVRLPWEPKKYEKYYYLNVNDVCVSSGYWQNHTYDYAMKALGIVYRTREGAEAHLEEDYMKLMGKPLSSR